MWYKVKKIYVGSRQVRPKTRNPWANTIFYIPFKSDSLDHSGNQVTTSWWGTITYQNPWALLTSEFTINYTWNPSSFTVSWYFKTNSVSIWWWIIWQAYIIYWRQEWWDLSFNADNNNNSLRIEFMGYPDWTALPRKETKSNIWVTSWHYYTLVVENWTMWYVYEDGVLKMSKNVQWYVPRAIDFKMAQWIQLYASEVILENKARTEQEIQAYYNLTKSNYWL